MESKNTPLVSVVMPAYNGSQFIQESLLSALRQDYSNIEYLVIDDASTDDTKEIITSIQEQDKRVKLINNIINQGIANTLNKGLIAAQGEYIAILDQDDCRIDPYKIHKQVEFLKQNQNVGFLGTNTIVKKQQDNGFVFYKSEHPLSDDSIKEKILSSNPFCHSSIMYRNMYNKIGGYDKNILYTDDYAYWLKAGIHTKFANLTDYTTLYNSHSQNTSHLHKRAQTIESLKLSRQYRNEYPNAFTCLSKKTYGTLYSLLSGYMETHCPLLKDEIRKMLGRPTHHGLQDGNDLAGLLIEIQSE